MDIQDLRIFARLAAVQSLSAVAAEMALTAGTISKRLQALETLLGARLFERNTRSMRITEEGQRLLAHATRILAEIDLAMTTVAENGQAPRGSLKIAAPMTHGRSSLAPALSKFLSVYPDIEVQIDLTEHPVNLQEDGYDVAIRSGMLSDSTLIAKRLARDPQVIVAAPSYVARCGAPTTPADLELHACLVVADQTQWPFFVDGAAVYTKVTGRIRSNSIDILCNAALSGHGILRVPEVRVGEELASGQLVRVLGDHDATGDCALWATYASAKHMPPRLRAFIDFLSAWYRDQPPAASLDNGSSSSAGAMTSDPARRRFQRSA